MRIIKLGGPCITGDDAHLDSSGHDNSCCILLPRFFCVFLFIAVIEQI